MKNHIILSGSEKIIINGEEIEIGNLKSCQMSTVGAALNMELHETVFHRIRAIVITVTQGNEERRHLVVPTMAPDDEPTKPLMETLVSLINAIIEEN